MKGRLKIFFVWSFVIAVTLVFNALGQKLVFAQSLEGYLPGSHGDGVMPAYSGYSAKMIVSEKAKSSSKEKITEVTLFHQSFDYQLRSTATPSIVELSKEKNSYDVKVGIGYGNYDIINLKTLKITVESPEGPSEIISPKTAAWTRMIKNVITICKGAMIDRQENPKPSFHIVSELYKFLTRAILPNR